MHLSRFSISLALCLTAAAESRAQAVPAQADSSLGTPVGPFIALSVANIERAIGWYRDTLGMHVHDQGVAPNGTIRFALLRQGTALIEILQLPDARSRTEAAPGTTGSHQIHGFFKSGLVVADLDGAYRRMKNMKVPMAYDLGRAANGPYRSFGVRDPEGNLVQFFGR